MLAQYLPAHAKPNLVSTRLERRLEVRRGEADGGTLSPGYVRELERLTSPEGHFAYFDQVSIFEISYGVIEDWSLWLADRGLSPKTRRNVLGAFRSFVGWLRRRGELTELPEFPWPKVEEHQPRILSAETQEAVLAAIPEAKRGLFLAMALMGIRPGEARAVDVATAAMGGSTWTRP